MWEICITNSITLRFLQLGRCDWLHMHEYMVNNEYVWQDKKLNKILKCKLCVRYILRHLMILLVKLPERSDNWRTTNCKETELSIQFLANCVKRNLSFKNGLFIWVKNKVFTAY